MNSTQTVAIKGPVEITDAKGNSIGIATDVEITTEIEYEEFSPNAVTLTSVPMPPKTTMKVKKWQEPMSSMVNLAPQSAFNDFANGEVVCEKDGFELVVFRDDIKDLHRFVLRASGKFTMDVTEEFLAQMNDAEDYVESEFLAVAKTLHTVFQGFKKKELKTPNPFKPPHNLDGTTVLGKLKKLFPNISKEMRDCPVLNCNNMTVQGTDEEGNPVGQAVAKPYRSDIWNLVQHLNDQHIWPRESIAEWLETLDEDITLKEG